MIIDYLRELPSVKLLYRMSGLIPLLSVSTVWSHEGHGHPAFADGPMHYVVNPSHSAWPVLLIVMVAIAAGMIIRGRTKSR